MSVDRPQLRLVHRLAFALCILLLSPASLRAEAVQLDVLRRAPNLDLAPRLEVLAQRLEELRVANHVPGMALAVVYRDGVVMARGFGQAQLAQGDEAQGDEKEARPATPETLFAIGSATKAFTATLGAMLEDEGRLTWDDPASQHLSGFQLAVDSDEPNAQATLRDLLSHRSGFTRMGVLWAGGDIDRKTMLSAAAKAEPWAPFRQGFHYNNVTYTAGGEAIARAAGKSWESLLSERLLQPLGMVGATVDLDQARRDPRLARGYQWNEERSSHQPIPLREMDAIAPAGAIVASALDMARWLRLQLGRGQFAGQQLLSERALRQTWSPQIQLPGGQGAYGLGWFLRQWRGQPVVEHGGNIEGYSSAVALLPDSDLGFVLLMNTTTSPLQQSSLQVVWETLLGEQPSTQEGEQSASAEDLQAYVGSYDANFGPFRDQVFEVTLQKGALYVDVPGQTNYEVLAANEEGRRAFAAAPFVEVAFHRDEQGQVVEMSMHQAGQTFRLPRQGLVANTNALAGNALEEDLESYFGTYRAKAAGLEYTVLEQNGNLAIDVPGQTVYELAAPDEEGWRVFRVSDGIKVRFPDEDEGPSRRMLFEQGGLSLEFQRLAETADPDLPTIQDLLSRRRAKQQQAAFAKGFLAEGKLRIAQAGVDGTLTWRADGRSHSHQTTDLGPFGKVVEVATPERAWTDSTFSPFQEHAGKYLEQAQLGHPAALFADWSLYYDHMRILRRDEHQGNEVLVLRLKRDKLPAVEAFVDPETGDVLETRTTVFYPAIGGIPMRTRFENYREVAGLRLPRRMVSENEASGRVIVELETVRTGVKHRPELFTFPEGKGGH